MSDYQVDEAVDILRIVAKDWRDLLAGSEGFLTGKGRAGFEGREVVWGDMVSELVYHRTKRLMGREWLILEWWGYCRTVW